MGRALPAAVVHAQLFTRSCSRRRASGGRRGSPLWGRRRARRGARAWGAPSGAGGGMSRKNSPRISAQGVHKQIKKIMLIKSANKWNDICCNLSNKLEISNNFGNSAAVLLHRICHSVFLGVGLSKSKLFHKYLSQFLRRPCCVKVPALLYYLI